MATQVVMPKLSPTMEEGQLARWLKREGDKVSVGEPIAEVDTDKATMEAQALAEGVLRKIIVPEGSTVPLGQVIAIIGAPDEDISELLSKVGAGDAGAKQQTVERNVEAGQDGAQQELAQVVPGGSRTQATIQGQPLEGEAGGGRAKGADEAATPARQTQQPQQQARQATPQQPAQGAQQAQRTSGDGGAGNGQRGGRVAVSPIAARMAADANINLRDLSGSGPGGRIIKRDIEAAMKSGTQATAAQTQQQTAQQSGAAQPQPQLRAVEARQQQPAQQPQIQGASPYRDEPLSTMRATIARRLVTSIGPVPHFFLTTEIEMDRASELRQQLNELDESNKISLNDIIIKVAAVALTQHPQVNASFQDKAIRYYERADIGVAVAIEDGLITPVVRDGQVVVRQLMRVTMSCDHRVIDGATGAKFLQTFKQLLENPLLML